jgi:hypothetical protein
VRLQAAVERDSAQSRADELSLDLNAVRREVAALRSQLARQQQDIIQLKLQLSQAAASAAAAAAVGSSGGGGSRGRSLGGRPGSPLGCNAAAAAAAAAAATGRSHVFVGHGMMSPAGSVGGAASAAVLPAAAMWQQQGSLAAARAGSVGFGSPQQQQQGVRSLGGAAGSSGGGAAEDSQVGAVLRRDLRTSGCICLHGCCTCLCSVRAY